MTNNSNNNHPFSNLLRSKLKEGLEQGDLERLVSSKVSIDEYKSKMGSDEEIVVVSFTIQGKEPALDLVNFVEKSYEWVADADVSSGEVFDGSYIVFVEIERTPDIAEQIVELLDDLERLTEHKVKDWDIEYAKTKQKIQSDTASLKAAIPGTPHEYRTIVKRQSNEIDQLKTAAGVKVNTVAPKNDFTESIRIMAGIR
jgi:paraquat-inducible protein B